MISQREVLAIKTTRELMDLELEDFRGRELTEPEFRHIFEVCDALWLHSRDSKAPHAELTSGKCSDGFVDTLRALRFANICQIMGYQAARKLRQDYGGRLDWVVGSDHAGVAFSHSVAIALNTQHDFTEKGPEKQQLWKRFTIQPDEVVLQAEELMTTSGTMLAVRRGIREGNAYPVTFAPVVLVLVHRSDIYEIEGTPVVNFVHYDIQVWDPEHCPLCAAGSKRLRPKTNWAELTGR